ncbi:hypothetical protein ADL03_15210 [Nocardia sp. NRRL S-836]|nr:hypothetical protein ADL03_15210 [Nocardia sp. NRRL S-836]
MQHLLDDDRVVVTRHDDGSVTLVWDEYNSTVASTMFELTWGMVFAGAAVLRDPPERFYAHPDGWCPACAEAKLEGPAVWGIWLPSAWYRSHVRAGAQAGEPARVQQFANREVAERMMRSYLATLRRHRQRSRSIYPAEVAVLDRDPRHAPRFRPESVGDDSQMWLWHNDPAVSRAVARRNGGWPDEVWSFRFDSDDAGGDIVVMTGAEFAALANAEDEAAQRRDRERRESRRTGDQVTRLDSCTIVWHRENEDDLEGYLISIRDDNSTAPAQRMLADGASEGLDGAPQGLTVFGRTRFDRPSFAAARAMAPRYAYLLDGIEQQRGTTIGS